MRTTTIVTTALCALIATTTLAQSVPDVTLPLSPPGQAAIHVGGAWSATGDGGRQYSGGKWIVVDYSRPLLRGRSNIFGSGAEYGQAVKDGAPVWRAGANETTTLTTQTPLVIGGKTVAPGVYNVFVDLASGAWTLILTNQPRQPKFDPNDKVNLYGAANYDPKFEVARVEMSVEQMGGPENMRHPLEQFTISFLRVSERTLMLAMAWDRTVATAPIEVAP